MTANKLRGLMLGAMLLLAGCANQAPLPTTAPSLNLPLQLLLQRTQAGQSQDWMLVIQQEAGDLRFSLLDLLGIPQARQRLVSNHWEADGLLPPNPEARELFAGLLFALTPAEQLDADYPGATADNHGRRLGERWAVMYVPTPFPAEGPAHDAVRANSATFPFTLTLQHDLSYRISPLPQEAAP